MQFNGVFYLFSTAPVSFNIASQLQMKLRPRLLNLRRLSSHTHTQHTQIYNLKSEAGGGGMGAGCVFSRPGVGDS